MNTIERVRPQSKRKAIGARRLGDKYHDEWLEARERGDIARAARLLEKMQYWRDRERRHSRLAHTWPE